MRYGSYRIQAGRLSKRAYLQDCRISVRDVPEHPDYPEHTHEFTELVAVYEGSGVNCVDEFEYEIGAGDVFVIHAGQRHAYKKTQHLHLCNVLFDSTLLDTMSVDMPHLPGFHNLFLMTPSLPTEQTISRMHLQAGELAKARLLIDELEREVDEKPPGFRLISQSLLLLLIGKLSRWYAPVPSDASNDLTRIATALAHMEATFYESLSVEALARMAGLSERTFYRVFQKATGATPNQYLTTLRLSHVADLLIHSDASITDIAFECGFQDSSYMAKQFKRQRGLSPRQFRENHRI